MSLQISSSIYFDFLGEDYITSSILYIDHFPGSTFLWNEKHFKVIFNFILKGIYMQIVKNKKNS